MNNRLFFTRLLLYLFIILSIISNVSAITVDPVNPHFASKLDEGAQINFTLKIKDLDQRNADYLKIETNLVKSGNSPIYDFGDLNEYLNINRDRPNLNLNLSSIPQNKIITVTISGQAPSGEIQNKNQDLVLTKFLEGNLKYYEVDNGDQPCQNGIQVFQLNNPKKEKFEDTMQQINLDELNTLKQDIRELFNIGLVTQAQKMASEMSEIKLRDYLKLFNIVYIKSDLSLNLVAISFLLLGFIIGFVVSKKTEKDETEE
jgi:hypothetical protein